MDVRPEVIERLLNMSKRVEDLHFALLGGISADGRIETGFVERTNARLTSLERAEEGRKRMVGRFWTLGLGVLALVIERVWDLFIKRP